MYRKQNAIETVGRPIANRPQVGNLPHLQVWWFGVQVWWFGVQVWWIGEQGWGWVVAGCWFVGQVWWFGVAGIHYERQNTGSGRPDDYGARGADHFFGRLGQRDSYSTAVPYRRAFEPWGLQIMPG